MLFSFAAFRENYTRATLLTAESTDNCYSLVDCTCVGSLAIAETYPYLGYECTGWEYCDNITKTEKCIDTEL